MYALRCLLTILYPDDRQRDLASFGFSEQFIYSELPKVISAYGFDWDDRGAIVLRDEQKSGIRSHVHVLRHSAVRC
jgi:hypothetical protein